MHALITGARGTVGSALQDELQQHGAQVTGWDRQAAAPGDAAAGGQLLDRVRPTIVYHLAVASQPTGVKDEGELVNVTWSQQLAELCAARGIGFVFTSSVMVFSDDALGPFAPTASTDAQDGYGFEKRRAEHAVRQANADARVVRLGWQIGDGPGSNNMMAHLLREHAEQGVLRPSTEWLPATSFLPDTAAALRAVADKPGGIYQIDGNRDWTYAEIVTALAAKHGLDWKIQPNADFVFDQRMTDPNLETASLATRIDLPAVDSV